MTTQIKLTTALPTMVAHRGYSGNYPENTLLAYQSAYMHGARWMELDLQLSADKVPMVHHDASLLRMAGVDKDIRDTPAAQITSMSAAYPQRFGDKFSHIQLISFETICQWLQAYSDVTMFVEIKQESIERFGVAVFMDAVYQHIASYEIETQCVIISFNPEVVEYSRSLSSLQTGWVLPAWNQQCQQRVQQLKPEFLFCDVAILPTNDEDVWQGSWQWALYNLDDVDSAVTMANRGFEFLETNQIGTLMSEKGLASRC